MNTFDDLSFHSQTRSAVVYSGRGGTFEIAAASANIARIRLDGGSDRAAVRYALPLPDTQSHVSATGGDLSTIATDYFSATVRTHPFEIDFAYASGEVMLHGMSFAMDEEGRADGARVRIAVRLPREHHFYGLGHGGGSFDRVGTQRQLWNSHVVHGSGSDFGVPLLVSNRGYALLFDTTADSRLTVGRSDDGTQILFDADGGPIDLYCLVAADTRGVLAVVAELLGRAAMPPVWFLGYHQSTRHFESTEELRRLAQTIREKRIPCDSLIFLSTYSEARGWNRQVGHLEFQPELWNDPRSIIGEMRAKHFQIILHEYPVAHPGAALFAEGRERGYLLEEGYATSGAEARRPAGYQEGQLYIDFSNEQARKWWWGMHRPLLDLDVAGWWLDGGEGPPARAKLAGGEGRSLHNVYDLLRYRAFSDGEAEQRPDRRPVMICRSGAAGMQRYGASCWSGDINNTFATLAAQIPLGLNTGMSGIPYWGTDIGGFFHPTAESAELYARWFQFGAFCPLFRSHGFVWREHLPWAHGDEVEMICRRYTELRYELLPYTYSLARQAWSTGLPLMRPLVLNYPDDPRVWDMSDEYLWGDDLLVAPVTREGARRWAVYLPKGAWHDYWSWKRYEGGQGVEVDAPLERLPLFVREGAIIPCGPPVQHTGKWPAAEITLLIVPGKESRFEIYDDDGTSNRHRDGGYAITAVECSATPHGVVITIEPPRGDGSVVPPDRRYVAKLRMPPPARVVDESGTTVPRATAKNRGTSGWWEEGGFVYVPFPRSSGAITLS